MKTLRSIEDVPFRDDRPNAEPLLVDDSGRVLRFSLRPHQTIREHCAPSSPVHIVILRGVGVFSGADGGEATLRTGDMVVYEAGELHSVRSADEELVFVALLHKAPDAPPMPSGIESDAYLTWHM
jgi:quercetin dioxygenase-like cupin family protein